VFLICQSDSFPSLWDRNVSAALFMPNPLSLTSNKSTWYIQFWVRYYCYNVQCKFGNCLLILSIGLMRKEVSVVHCCLVLGNVLLL
jgi:hypothetical protein